MDETERSYMIARMTTEICEEVLDKIVNQVVFVCQAADTMNEVVTLCVDVAGHMESWAQELKIGRINAQELSELREVCSRLPSVEYVSSLDQLKEVITMLESNWRTDVQRVLAINVVLVDKEREAETFNMSLRLTWDNLVEYGNLLKHAVDEDYIALFCLAMPSHATVGTKVNLDDTIVFAIDLLRITRRVSLRDSIRPYSEALGDLEKVLSTYKLVGYEQKYPLCLLLRYYDVEVEDRQYREITDVFTKQS
ncbi:MAG: hypothetical protein GY696_02905, partial [Gammaproteobacteria bacterium]|nr:hypothetical protein [Gammaproteobacteria bacterium]